jgi:hypothetical protein
MELYIYEKSLIDLLYEWPTASLCLGQWQWETHAHC